MNVRKLMVLLLAVLALAVAGCGGDDSTATASGDTDTTVVEETTTEDTTEETTTEDRRDDDRRRTASLGGKCAEFAGSRCEDLAGVCPAATRASTRPSELFDELASEVPDEIRADFEVHRRELPGARRGAQGRRPRGRRDAERRGPREAAGAHRRRLDSPEVQQASREHRGLGARELLAVRRRTGAADQPAPRSLGRGAVAPARQSRSTFGTRNPSATAGSAGRPSRSKT